MINRLSRGMLLAFMAIMAAFWWLMMDTDGGNAPAKPIHIAELRRLAAFIPGQRPTAVTFTMLGVRMVPGDYFAAGIGLKRRPVAIVAWSLPVPGKGPILIDPGQPPEEAGMGNFDNFDYARQARIDADAGDASLILYTQRRQDFVLHGADHAGKAGLRPVSAERKPSPLPMSYTTAQAVAPGVVVIPASSHSPGTRLIFVQLANGQEFLFTGNISPLIDNWVRLRGRSHLAAVWGPAQNRTETYAWLRTIHQLRVEAPQMNVAPGHDYIWLMRQQGARTIAGWQP